MPTRPNLAILSPLQRKPGRTQGGLETVVTHVANGLCGLGMTVDVLVMPPKGGDPRPPGINPRVRIVNLRTPHKLIGFFALARYLRREQPSVMLTAGHRANMLALWARMFTGLPIRLVLSVHNTMSHLISEQALLKRLIRSAGIRWGYRRADAIVAVSQGVADDLQIHFDLPVSLLHVIHNPVVTPQIIQQACEEPLHPWLAAAGPPVILGVGRLRRQKDFPTLIRAFDRVRRQHDCRLIILGEGKERSTLENIVRNLSLENHVSLPGFAPNPFSYMRRAAVFVMSSAWEGFGNVLVEALAVGVPVISTDCPSGPREILADGHYGDLVPVGDVEALAQAILHTLDSPIKPELRNEAVARFTIERAATAYAKLLQLSNHP